METASESTSLRLGLFGGSFDPVHLGHLEIARSAQELFGLDEVHFILANVSPFKFQDKLKDHENAEVEIRQECKRAEILKLALEDYHEDDENAENFKLNLMELNREPPSYTYQTVEEFKVLYPTAKLFWIMGSDSFSELPKWKNVNYLIENLEFIVFRRKEIGLNTEKLLESELFNRDEFIDLKKKLKVNFIENPYIDVSSTLIRKSILNSNNLNALDGKLSNPSKGLVIENYRKRFRE
ncbi:MAG: nicotinate (nicotinamide) nucleotide adenylyltransferase [Vampirovibrionia bacterium]